MKILRNASGKEPEWIRREIRWLAASLLLFFCGPINSTAAGILLIEFRQQGASYNFQSVQGVPISAVTNVPPGSNGKLPSVNQSGTGSPATTNQFRGFISFGGIAGPTNITALTNSTILRGGLTVFSGDVAAQMQLPVARSNGVIVMVARRVQVGAPYLSRPVSFLFGGVIPAPDTDENGVKLGSSGYWLPEPYSTSNHTNDNYYWSPNANVVYASQAGPVSVTWRTAASTTVMPAGYATNPTNYFVVGGNYFRLFTKSYLVSGSAIKPTRKIYWTEKTFQPLGKLIIVPPTSVKGVTIVYNSSFPKTVTAEYIPPGQTSFTDGTTNLPLPELRTLWFAQEQGNIHAYNQEGRVLVELLGDFRSDGTSREQLGFEIVDVIKQVNPFDVTIELGERVTPAAPGTLTNLYPEPILQPGSSTFAFQQNVAGSGTTELYATQETQNQNDYLVHWMELGEVGLKWPGQFARYKFIWPADIAKYSHYIRPLVDTDLDAQATAVPLSTANVPIIEYQDPLDFPRARLTPDFKFYTFLTPAYPAERVLLRFSSGEDISFERVFSWLDVNLLTTNFTSSVVTNLTAWNPANNSLNFPAASGPRIVTGNVLVGQRIVAPAGEIGANSDTSYYAGYIHQPSGASFDVNAYVDPFASGAAAANAGAIIPVNAIPGANNLEVWWFRSDAADATKGFAKTYWPSVLGQYTIQWPSAADEIVLASNQGSPPDPLVASGSIYVQNDPTLPGYNPNEEHAIMTGGVAYALRDDLNITNAIGYSSHPYVLVDYKASDGRPALAVYKVRREKPEAGILFDYIVPAGTLLQAPLPLSLLPPPVEGSGDNATNYNTESSPLAGDLPGNWVDKVNAGGPYDHYKRFTFRDRKQGFWVYRGLHAGLPPLTAGTYSAKSNQFNANPSAAIAVAGQPFNYALHVSRSIELLSLAISGNGGTPAPAWLSVTGISIQGTPALSDIASNNLLLVVTDIADQTTTTNNLLIQVVANGTITTQGPLDVLSTNRYTGSIVDFTNRPPYLAQSPVPSNSFTMRFYYKTLPGFAWPGMLNPPAIGSIVPYLRPIDPANNVYVGDAGSKSTPSLEIVYRPTWPELQADGTPLPVLPYGQTLLQPVNGLPGVRNFKTANILYQQSIAANIQNASVSAVLDDPTRAKMSDLAAQGLAALPTSIPTTYYQGKYFFQTLPPHLSTRLFFDPNAGASGSLVFTGEFQNELTGVKYILLNVLRGTDLNTVKALCPQSDSASYPKWTNLVGALATKVETFFQNTNGVYVPNSQLTAVAGVGDLAVITNDNTAVDSYALSGTGPGSGYITLLEASGTAFTQPGDPVAMHILKVGGSLYSGQLKVIAAPNPLSEQTTLQHTGDLAGRADEYEYEWKIAAPVNGLPPVTDGTMSGYLPLTNALGVVRYTIGGAGIQALSDNWLVMRYRPKDLAHPLYNQWSNWTDPQLAEGWIKRVLAGINPFNQRTGDLFNNIVDTDVSIVSQAGHRWEGDIALNADTLNQYGLIEIYETILRRGRALSIDSGFDYGPANDALLLAAGYLNDLYMMLGNEASDDAANPTIGIGTKDNTYGDIATALFSFNGEVASLLEEELALLRGRDDFLLPSVQSPPFYNRLFWNYTGGISSGQVIYALNYNILDQDGNGVVDAADAAILFPQGHGDAYGHYLTALKGYYSLLINPKFDWVPRIEAVSVLGQPISVDYFDERKFAAAAAAVARTGNQIFDLTWRRDYQPGHNKGWDYLDVTVVNSSRTYTTPSGMASSTEYWGLDHWATRVGQGAYLNWVVGNAILPAVDPDPTHAGIQKVDRTTVPELLELPVDADSLQTSMNNAENGLTPFGFPDGSVAFDINPNQIVGTDNGTHFEQVYSRAIVTLNNAVAAFDDAKDVTRLMRSEQDSLQDLKNGIEKQELAYTNSLIEIYGTPYQEDIGPGKLYAQGYSGPDLFHFAYVDDGQLTITNLFTPNAGTTVKIDIQNYSSDYEASTNKDRFAFIVSALNNNPEYKQNVDYINFTMDASGAFQKPADWVSHRDSPGTLQEGISRIMLARNALMQTLSDNQSLKRKLDLNSQYFAAKLALDDKIHAWDSAAAIAKTTVEGVVFAGKIGKEIYDQLNDTLLWALNTEINAIPASEIVGLADGGDILSGARAALLSTYAIEKAATGPITIAKQFVTGALQIATDGFQRQNQADVVGPQTRDLEDQSAVLQLDGLLSDLQGSLFTINQRIQELDAATRNYRAIIASGDRIQNERLIFRQRSAAIIQGFRTRDAAFRLFRNEKLERYNTLFDLAARYAYLAANAYDYETGLLNTEQGRGFLGRIIGARSLGVVRNGQPQYAGSDTGDPGLSSALAEMKADWDVLRGRLGFNNPDAYGTTASLRVENYRILPGTNGIALWQNLLRQSEKSNLLDDADVRRYCLQIDPGGGLAVPGLILEFSTTIDTGLNLFGQPLAPGDHAYSPSSFATKIFAVGVALEGYRGMDDPAANGSAVTAAGASSPSDPNGWYLDPLGLSANPYIYLIPVGTDAMRSPPLGDVSVVRTWTVNDVAIPLPFNIGASDFSTKPSYLSSDSLTEPFFTIRKHPAFRPVSSPSFFSTSLYGDTGTLKRSQYTNNRLVGRSVWNTKWKLIIPANTLLSNPNDALDRFIQTVTDIKVHYVTYSYSGN